jgi:hypothetical protein
VLHQEVFFFGAVTMQQIRRRCDKSCSSETALVLASQNTFRQQEVLFFGLLNAAYLPSLLNEGIEARHACASAAELDI